MAPIPLAPQEVQRTFDELAKTYPGWFSVRPQKEAQWVRASVEWARRTGRGQDVLRHLDRLVELEPARAMTWAERGSVRAEHGRWTEAIADFEKASELRPDAAEHVRDLALARLGSEDEAGFRRACAQLRDRFGATDNPDRAQWVVRTCVLAPPTPSENFSDLARAAERWREVEPEGVHQLGTLGAALMRGGSVDAAATLRRALQAAGPNGDSWTSLFLQIAEAKQRRRKAPCSKAASAARADATQQPNVPNTNVTWRDRVALEALARELCARVD